MSGTTTNPLTITIDATGIHIPTFGDVEAYLTAAFLGIYGADTYLGNDSQDGQLLGIFASAINDAYSAVAAVYAAYSPQTAQGTGLSSAVRINGLTREIASNSSVDVVIIGQPITIKNGVVQDTAGNLWNLPVSVTIPPSGTITVTAVAQQPGNITAAEGTVNKPYTPTYGWQTVTNPGPAIPGNPIETDATLRQRQAVSTALPSLSILDGLIGSIATLSGVGRYQVYENDDALADTNGVPPHSVAVVVEGGDAQSIAQLIFAKKGIGTGTYGTTSEMVLDTFGIAHQINFFVPTEVPVTVTVNITPLANYTTVIGAEIQTAVVAYLNALSIGETIYLNRLYVPANLAGPDSNTFNVASILIARVGSTPTAANLKLAFNEVASGIASNVTVLTGG